MKQALLRWIPMWCVAWFCIWVPGLGCEAPKPAEVAKEAGKESPTEAKREAPADARLDAGVEPRGEPSPREVLRESSPDSPAASLEQICSQIAEATCAPLIGCCPSRKAEFKDRATCVASLAKQCSQTGYAKEGAALKSGLIQVMADKLKTCLALIAKAGQQCRGISGPEVAETCKQIFRDPAASGEQCKSKLGGLSCAGGKGLCFPTPTGFPCMLYTTQGGACSAAPCAPGLLCSDSGPSGVCEGPLDEGKSCRISPQCKAGLACLEGKCKPQLAKGASCDNVGQCQRGLECDSRQGKCVEQVAKGASCSFPAHCLEGLYCHQLASGLVCQPPVEKGEACRKREDCAAGLGCIEGKCADLPAKGQACTKQSGCQSTLLCDLAQQRCVDAPQKGQTCIQGEVRCAEGLACLKGTCQDKGAKGAPCEPGSCGAGLGCDSQMTCQDLPSQGPCLGGFFCASGFYCDLGPKTCHPHKKVGETCPIGLECGPQQACLADGEQVKRCQPLPKRGQPCTLACATGLSCRLGLSQGVCTPTLCNGVSP